jgi:hypothetical protein
MNGSKVGYGPVVGHSPEGYPIYLYTDPRSKLTQYVVVLPDHRAFYCDTKGRIVSKPTEANPQIALGVIGGLIGLLVGGGNPLGAILGGIVGAALGNEASKKRAK